jgi:hypothetical protein
MNIQHTWPHASATEVGLPNDGRLLADIELIWPETCDDPADSARMEVAAWREGVNRIVEEAMGCTG